MYPDAKKAFGKVQICGSVDAAAGKMSNFEYLYVVRLGLGLSLQHPTSAFYPWPAKNAECRYEPDNKVSLFGV